MNSILELGTEYWRPIAIGVSVLLYVIWDKIGNLVKNIKLPKLSNKVVEIQPNLDIVPNLDELESIDIRALTHLRKRAVAVKDMVLLKDIKNAAGKFFDIHSGVSDTDVNGV